MRIINIGVAVALLSGCATLKSIGKNLGVCAVDATEKEVMNLLPVVSAILEGNAPDWQSQLVALESLGVDAVVCAVAQVTHSLSQEQGFSRAAVSPQLVRAVARGQSYLQTKGIQ